MLTRLSGNNIYLRFDLWQGHNVIFHFDLGDLWLHLGLTVYLRNWSCNSFTDTIDIVDLGQNIKASIKYCKGPAFNFCYHWQVWDLSNLNTCKNFYFWKKQSKIYNLMQKFGKLQNNEPTKTKNLSVNKVSAIAGSCYISGSGFNTWHCLFPV